MKPPRFEYHRAQSVSDAIAALTSASGGGKILAGGQSLVPLLNFRLASPTVLVDLNRVDDLAYIERTEDRLRIGAMTRTRQLETDGIVGEALPVVAEAASWVGHVQIRNRGTVGGSLAHADPAAELPAMSLLLDARLAIEGPSGTRSVDAVDFFQGFFTTAVGEDEVLTEVALRIPPAPWTWGFREFAHRHGDFALAGAGCVVELAGDGRVEQAATVVFGIGQVPVRLPSVEAALRGRPLDAAAIDDAAGLTLEASRALEDERADAGHRRSVAAVVMKRALEDAARRPVA